ncbi:hypothetical protein HAX54_000404 [Datura stramonium]|uniref:Uncharacterized protein n=1 Tax=Datura stramonium TaxID=4076 RepID=A0ABS8T0Y9_DATST|nr:hypothetical protein [Datura stramonium]
MPSGQFGQIGGLRHPLPGLEVYTTSIQYDSASNFLRDLESNRVSASCQTSCVFICLILSSTAYPDRPLTPAGNSPGWSQSLWNNQTGQGPNNMIAMAPPPVSPQGSHHLASRPVGVSAAPHIDVFRGHNLAPQSSGPAPSAHMPPLRPSSGSTPAHFLNHSMSSGQPVIPSLSPNPPHHPQNPASPAISRLISQFGSQELPPSNQMMRPHLRPAIDNPNPPPVIQGFQRPQLNNQISQSGPPMSLDFARPAGPLPQFRHPTFSNQELGSNNVFFRHGRASSSSSAAHQIYDPFSPTSVPRHPHPGGNPAMAEKQESDPEYEDLMASVGVK